MKSLPALLAACALSALPLYAAGLDDLTWTTTDSEITISRCDETASGELVIPGTIEGKPVTSIGLLAFLSCTNLVSITIPEGVTSIGDGAFYDCRSLTSVTVPDSVISIGSYTFWRCKCLARITIPDGVTAIRESAFYDCSSLTSITIPNQR